MRRPSWAERRPDGCQDTISGCVCEVGVCQAGRVLQTHSQVCAGPVQAFEARTERHGRAGASLLSAVAGTCPPNTHAPRPGPRCSWCSGQGTWADSHARLTSRRQTRGPTASVSVSRVSPWTHTSPAGLVPLEESRRWTAWTRGGRQRHPGSHADGRLYPELSARTS